MKTRENPFNRLVLRVSVFLLLSFGAMSAQTAVGDAGAELTFSFGESCEQLFDLIDDELRALTSPAHADSFARMCIPEWPNTCEDYSAVVAQFGDLKSSVNDYFCHFSPR
jgi:hypothetical protein